MIVRDGRYGDFSAVPDYQQALAIVRHADEQFANLDVTVRNRFDNDPVKFLAFVEDPKNIDEVERMGLLKPEVVEARRLARVKAEAEASAKFKAETELKAQESEKALIDKVKAAISQK